MADDVAQLVNDVLDEGAFDATSTQALRWLNRRHRQMCARSRCYRKTVVVASTVASQRDYDVPAGIVEAFEITVAGVTYGPGSHSDISAAAQSRLTLAGYGGVFVSTASDAGVTRVALLPVPATGGDEIDLYAAFLPPDLTLDGSAGGTLRVDTDALEGLLAGVFATALARPNESRQDLAAGYEQQFASACEELHRRVNRRLKGSGAGQIRLQGANA